MPIARTLIKKSEVRRRLLEIAEEQRAHKFSRVSSETYEYVEDAMERVLQNLIARQPSLGKTIIP